MAKSSAKTDSSTSPQVSGAANVFDSIPELMLAEGLLSRPSHGGAAAIGLTAMKSGSGVTSIAAGLAASLAREPNQRVIVIDANASAHRLRDVLKMQADPVHVGKFELGKESEGAALHAVHTGPCGYDVAVLAGAPGLLPQEGFKQWWSALVGRYTIIVLDLGALETGLPLRWNGIVDQFVLVLDASRDTREMAENLTNNQEFSKLPFKGFIINKRRYYVPNSLYRLFS